ncbi:MAG: hypothetical protein ABGW87_13655 [Sphingomonadaceae bacterium]
MSDFTKIVTDPEWILHRYDAASDRFQFIHTSIDTIRSETFMADIKPLSDSHSMWVNAMELTQISIPTVPVHFIFHTAFCRSTLLVSALDIPSVSFGLSEPAVLNDLAMAGAKATRHVKTALTLLARPIIDAKTIIVKPSNVANNLIGPMLQASPDSRALLLSGELPEFLQSIHKKGLGGRTWARRLYRHVNRYSPLDLGLRGDGEFELTDLQVAALAWFLQQRHFAMLLHSLQCSRLETLMSNDLIDRREAALLGVAHYFSLETDDARLSELVRSDIFSRHAKLGGDYAEVVAAQSGAARSPIVDDEIAMIEKWIDLIITQTGLAIPVRKPVIER